MNPIKGQNSPCPLKWSVKIMIWVVGIITVGLLMPCTASLAQSHAIEELLEEGGAAYARSDYQKAWENWKAGYELAIGKGDRRNEAKLLTSLGMVQLAQINLLRKTGDAHEKKPALMGIRWAF